MFRSSRSVGLPGLRRARPLALVAVGLLSLLVALAGCGNLVGGAPAPSAQQINDKASHSAMKDAKLALTGSLTTNLGGTDMAITLTGDGNIVVKPAAAFHLAMTMNLSSQQVSGTITLDLIQVGGKDYAKTQINIPGLPTGSGSDKYSVMSAPADQATFIPKITSGLKVAGEDTIRGDKCWHLTGTYSTNASGTPVASGTSGATTIHVEEWIRESDYYYVRLKMDTLPGLSLPISESSTPSSGASGSANAGFTLDFSDYDKGVTINPPPADQIATS